MPDEKIILNNKFVEIGRANKKDKVVSHDSSENRILEKFSRDYNGKVITLKNALGSISITPEHLIYAIKIPAGDAYKRIKGKKKLIPSWYHAEDLKKGDIILYPFSRKEKDTKHLRVILILSRIFEFQFLFPYQSLFSAAFSFFKILFLLP